MSRSESAEFRSNRTHEVLSTVLRSGASARRRTQSLLDGTTDRMINAINAGTARDFAPGAHAIPGSLASKASPTIGMKLRLLLTVLLVVFALSLAKAVIHLLGLEFLAPSPLVTSAMGGSIFVIGFLLSGVLADYKESERLPGEIRVSLEALHDDIARFCAKTGKLDPMAPRQALIRVVTTLRRCLGGGESGDNHDMTPVLAEVDDLTGLIERVEDAGMAPNMVVRLKNTHDSLRRSLYRIYHVQATQFVPSVHILVQTLVGAILFLLLFLNTEGTFQSALFFGFIAYIYVYALYLIEMLEEPFRKGHGSMDDVSLFLLYEFADKLRAEEARSVAAE